MHRIIRRRIGLAVLAAVFPMVSFANVSETLILPANMAINLETGGSSSSGGDLLWNGTTIAPVGVAKIRNLGKAGLTNFNLLTESYWVSVAAAAKANPLAANLLVTGDVFVAVTNGGHTAKAIILDNTGGSITLSFTTFEVAPPAGVPLVTQILNNSSYVPVGFPNYGIAPSSVFAVFGSGMSDPGDPVPQASAAPGLPLSLSGSSVAVVVNGVTTHPALYYTSPTQLAAVLPAATPAGAGTLTVTYRGTTSAPAPILVVPSALGFNNYSLGVAVATDASTYALFSYTNSAKRGQTIVLWATGLGADAADSDTTYTTSPHSVNTPLQVYIGEVPAKILYQGASGYPGVNQIDLVIPKSAPTGCWVPVAAVGGGVVSNVVTISINDGGGACFDAASGLNGNQILPPNGKALKAGLVSLVQTNSTGKNGVTITNSANAAFEQYTGLYPSRNPVSPGGCLLIQGLRPALVLSVTGLDTGAITFTGPDGAPVTLKSQGIKGAFYSILPAGGIPQSGGTFTFKGAGGTDVGSFTSTVTLNNPLMTWTNPAAAATVDTGKGLLVTWSGGNPGSYVFITATSTSNSLGVLGGYTCLVSADSGQFTVPSYILSGLGAGKGGAQLQNYITYPLVTSGLDTALGVAAISHSVPAVFQ